MSVNVKIKNERLKAARHIIKDVVFQENFQPVNKIRFGPRYYIVQGLRGKTKSIFKICLYTDSVDHLTNEKFSREILFLNFLQSSKFKKVTAASPVMYSFGIKPRAWYMREYLDGKTLNVNNGNIRFKKEFFTKKNLEWFTEVILNLQKIQSANLPNNFKKLLYHPDFTKHLWRFISPHWQKIEQYMKWPGVAKLIKKEFNKYAPIYNKAPRVLAHQEPYSCHFLKTAKGMRLIDWENIGWANPNHDPAVLWMRSSQHQAWQKNLFYKFKNHYKQYKHFNELWTIEVLIQSAFNIISYYYYPNKSDIIQLVRFSDKKIREILTNNFKHYN